jgi:hypothetical protein
MGGMAGATLLASGTVQSDLEHVAVQPQDRIDIGFQNFGIDIDRSSTTEKVLLSPAAVTVRYAIMESWPSGKAALC